MNGDLEEKVYMQVSPGMENESNRGLVCKLRKSLYVLKQSLRAWFDRFVKVMIKSSYHQCQADHTLFVKYANNKTTILIVYWRNDLREILNLKKMLTTEFEIKDMGSLRYFLGMEVARSKDRIVISQ